MRMPNRAAKLMISAAIVITVGVAYGFAQTAVPAACGPEELWLSGEPGRQTTVARLRIPPLARLDEGVTFCVHGVVVKSNEATMIERDGVRTFTLRGTVTLTLPSR
jgi:hypothetical protein